MLTMPIKEKMATMQHQKRLHLLQDELSKVQHHRATFIEPLQETTLQTTMTLTDTHAEVQKILEDAKEKIVEHITAQTMANVLESTTWKKSLTDAAKEKVRS